MRERKISVCGSVVHCSAVRQSRGSRQGRSLKFTWSRAGGGAEARSAASPTCLNRSPPGCAQASGVPLRRVRLRPTARPLSRFAATHYAMLGLRAHCRLDRYVSLMSSQPSCVTRARSSWRRTMVVVEDSKMAGPLTSRPARTDSRSYTGTSVHRPRYTRRLFGCASPLLAAEVEALDDLLHQVRGPDVHAGKGYGDLEGLLAVAHVDRVGDADTPRE